MGRGNLPKVIWISSCFLFLSSQCKPKVAPLCKQISIMYRPEWWHNLCHEYEVCRQFMHYSEFDATCYMLTTIPTLLGKASKKTIESVIMIIPHRTPPLPLFLKTVIALRFLFCDVFWFIGWFRYVLKHILSMFKTNIGSKRLYNKYPLNLWSWSYLAGIRWKRHNLFGHLYWK